MGAEILVWVSEKQKPDEITDTVIHESVHIFQMLCTYIGENKGNEFEAYMIAYIAISLLKEIKKQQESSNALHVKRET